MAETNIPNIRFRDSFLLIGTIYDDISPAYNQGVDERHKLDSREIYQKMQEYEAAWRPYESRILEGMCKALNLSYRQNVIDVYGAPFRMSLSSPLFLATKYTPDRSVEVLAHELTHVLLYDNTSDEVDLHAKLEDKWREEFGEEHDVITLIHIPVHAVIQHIFDDVLGEPWRTASDKKACENDPSYRKAWEYVDRVGYTVILDQIRARE